MASLPNRSEAWRWAGWLAALLVAFAGSDALGQRDLGHVPGEGKASAFIRLRGNRKDEDDAIRINIGSKGGEKLDSERLREDIRALWRMGYFEDVQVQATDEAGDKVGLTFILREKPVIRKIYVAGAKEIGLDKINEVLDLKKDTILDSAKVKRNVEKVRDLYVEKGFYLAEVTSDVKRVSPNEVDVYIIVDEHAKVEVRQIRFLGNKIATADELKGAMGTQEGGWLSFLTSAGTYREDAFDRDLLLLQAFYYDRGYINAKLGKPEAELSAAKQYPSITIPVTKGLPYNIGKIDFKGDLLYPKDIYFRMMSVHPSDVFNRSKLAQDITRLNDIYKDSGYAYVNIQPPTAIDASSR